MKKILDIIKQLNPFSKTEPDNKIIYILRVLITAFAVYFVSLIIGETLIIGGSMPFGYNGTDKQLPPDIMLLVSFYGYIITILFFILFAKKINKLKTKDIGLDNNFKTFFKGILLGIGTLGIIITILLICGAIEFNGINKNVNYIFVFLYLFGYIIQSAMEEVICRGYILHRLKNKISLPIAFTISVAFFSVNHFSKLFEAGTVLGIIGCINLLLISVIWTLLTLKDKNIYSSIGFHFIWNFALFNIIGLNLSGIDATNSIFKFNPVNTFLTGSSYGIESSIITAIILGIVTTVLALRTKTK